MLAYCIAEDNQEQASRRQRRRRGRPSQLLARQDWGGTATTNIYDKENRLTQVQQATSPTPSLPSLTNASFEVPSLGTGGSAYQYGPTGTGVGWSFPGGSGVAGNGSAFTSSNPNAPDGTQVAFLQATGTFSQSFTLTSAAIVAVSFHAAQRATGGLNGQEFTVSIGSTVVGTFTPASASYALLTTGAIALAAGTYTLTFTGLNPLGGDNTAFIDEVALVAGTLVSAYTYAGEGLKRTELVAGALTTLVWDGDDYLQGRS